MRQVGRRPRGRRQRRRHHDDDHHHADRDRRDGRRDHDDDHDEHVEHVEHVLHDDHDDHDHHHADRDRRRRRRRDGGTGGTGGSFQPPLGTADYPAEQEPNDIKSQANPLQAGTKGFTASLYPLGDIDVFEFTVTVPGTSVSVTTSDGMGGCPAGATPTSASSTTPTTSSSRTAGRAGA